MASKQEIVHENGEDHLENGLLTEKFEEAADIADLNSYSDKKSYAKGLVDVALLTANANQLKHAFAIDDMTYKVVNVTLVLLSLILQVSIWHCDLLKVRSQIIRSMYNLLLS